ncbi:hypothetical protein H5410_038332 [Solanum commersonii]|uniref:Uncharacterized protein n=1 Tax=Solanum commersonii TaxID=4109 RepID=A0A9J5YCU2_SOLCO|nr:hypothetical protein H5410_038332 [Solanum commersonii]
MSSKKIPLNMFQLEAKFHCDIAHLPKPEQGSTNLPAAEVLAKRSARYDVRIGATFHIILIANYMII